MKTLVRYAIVRFMPFLDTQEFANVGIVLYAPDLGLVDFKLAPKRFGRVSQFFDDVDGKLYASAIDMFTAELTRVRDVAQGLTGRQLASFMDEVTRPREGFMVYGETANMLTDDVLPNVLEQLFTHYVGRAFNTPVHREELITKELKMHLGKVTQHRFRKQKLLAGYATCELPLVATVQQQTKAIKPICFDQKTPIKLIDHGERWIGRVKHLLQQNAIAPHDFMFAVERPQSANKQLQDAYWSLKEAMCELEVAVTSADDLNAIAKFAHFDFDEPQHFTLAVPR